MLGLETWSSTGQLKTGVRTTIAGRLDITNDRVSFERPCDISTEYICLNNFGAPWISKHWCTLASIGFQKGNRLSYSQGGRRRRRLPQKNTVCMFFFSWGGWGGLKKTSTCLSKTHLKNKSIYHDFCKLKWKTLKVWKLWNIFVAVDFLVEDLKMFGKFSEIQRIIYHISIPGSNI